jgi:hypothetical protein
MKSTLFLLPLLLTTAVLSACNNDNSASLADKIKTEVAQDIETDMNKAISDAKSDLTDISVTLKDGSKAKITSNGDMTIEGKVISLNDQQRALSKSYYDATKKIALQGIEIGKESAKLATQAIGTAIGGLMSGNTDTAIEKTIEAKAGKIEAVAQKLCVSANELKAIQEKLTAAVPAFTAEPIEITNNKDGCEVKSTDNHAIISTSDDKALTEQEVENVEVNSK